jgi:hypothetical protein
MAGTENPLMMVMETAAEMMLLDEVPAMLAGIFEEGSAVCFVLMKDAECAGPRRLCNIDELNQLAGEHKALAGIIKRLSKLKERKQPE